MVLGPTLWCRRFGCHTGAEGLARMRTSAAVLLVALLSATLGGSPAGDGGGVACVAEAAPVAPRAGWHHRHRHHPAGIANRAGYVATRSLAAWALWPSRVAHAASCLRFDPETGSINGLAEEEIEKGAVPKVIAPVKHPGRPLPVPKDKVLLPGQWHSWTAIGPILDDEYRAARPNVTETARQTRGPGGEDAGAQTPQPRRRRRPAPNRRPRRGESPTGRDGATDDGTTRNPRSRFSSNATEASITRCTSSPRPPRRMAKIR